MPRFIADELVRAVSVYHDKSRYMLFNIINPVYWIKCVLTYIVRIPFFFLETAGFGDISVRAEASFWGKLLKLGILVLAIAADLHTFGFLRSVWNFIKELIKS